MRYDGAFWVEKLNVAVGTPAVIELAHAGRCAVSLKPAETGSAVAEYTLSSLEDIAIDDAVWLPLVSTEAGAPAAGGRELPTRAIRITAITANCDVAVLQ